MSTIHGNTVRAKIRQLDKDIINEAISIEIYQRELRSLLAKISDWNVRLHYENLALLPLERRH